MQETNQSVDQRAFRIVIPTAIWTVGWMASLALAKFGPELLWDHQPVVSWVAIAVNVAVGLGWIVAHARYLRRVDDLQRKILMDGMAVALGVGLVGGFAYSVADSADLVTFNGSFAFVSALMAVVYAVATVVGTLRYR
jgi:hypothetical protein